jgi:PAS domain-containing protein
MNGFWTIQQVLAFTLTFAAVLALSWRVILRLFQQSSETHAKINAIESLLNQVKEKGMTAGAEAALSRLERRLVLTQAQVRVVMEVDGTGYIETDKAGGLTYCNTQFVHWTGMNIDEAKGFGWAGAIHENDRSRIVNEWASAVKDQRAIDLWYSYKYNQVITPVHARCIVVRNDHDDEVLGYVALIVPFSE